MVDGQWTDNRQRTDDGPWLYYKLTNEPKGSGELINKVPTALHMNTIGTFQIYTTHHEMFQTGV